MVVYGAGKERIFVSICSAVYLSNFVAKYLGNMPTKYQCFVICDDKEIRE
jgi:hypothetical protein